MNYTKQETPPSKLKCLISFKHHKTHQNIPSKIEFTKHNIKLSFPSISHDSLSYLNDIFTPLFKPSSHSYIINYSFITKTATNSLFNIIALELTNPIMNTNQTIILSNMETQSVLFKKRLSNFTVKSLVTYLQKRSSIETTFLMEKYMSLLTMFKECLEPQKRENRIIEGILVNSYFFGKKYYEKYHNEIKMKHKLIKSEMKKHLSKQLKQFEDLITEHDRTKMKMNFVMFDTMINEFKLRTSLLIEETICFLFEVINAEKEKINLDKVDKYSITKKLTGINNSMCIKGENEESRMKRVNDIKKNVIFKKYSQQCNNNSHNKSSILFQQGGHHKRGETLEHLNFNISCDSIFQNKNILNNTLSNITKHNNDNKHKSQNKLGLNLSNVFNPLNNSNINNNKIDIISTSTKTTSKGNETKMNIIESKKKKSFPSQTADLLETPKFFTNAQKVSNLFTKSKFPKNITNHNNNLNKTFNGNIPDNTTTNNSFHNMNNSVVISNDVLFKINNIYDKESISIVTISQQIEHLCKRHSFFPPVDTMNIFINTAEIIHRRFFEESFKLYLPDLFEMETDNDSLIKIESLYNMFMYLRSMKTFLFTEQNRVYMTSILFVSDDLIL